MDMRSDDAEEPQSFFAKRAWNISAEAVCWIGIARIELQCSKTIRVTPWRTAGGLGEVKQFVVAKTDSVVRLIATDRS